MSHNFNESSIYGVDDFKHKIHQLLSDRDTKSKLKARLRIVWIKYEFYMGICLQFWPRLCIRRLKRLIDRLAFYWLKCNVLRFLNPRSSMKSWLNWDSKFENQSCKVGCVSQWSFRPYSACGSIETTTIEKTHSTLD